MRSSARHRPAPYSRVRRRFLAGAGAALLVAGCGRGLRDVLSGGSPRERYARGLEVAQLDSSAMGREWLSAGQAALRAPVPVTIPFREARYLPADSPSAVGYAFVARRGQRIIVTIDHRSTGPARVFADLFRLPEDSSREPEREESADSAGRALSAAVPDDGHYILRIQPELLRSVRYTVVIRLEPQLAFPVAGRDSRAIESVFGDPRDAGARRHEGIDIFAPRGTPALAAADGLVTRTGTNTLGGKVVWLSDPRRQQSLYYAHLDSQIAHPGQRVHQGDTLGLVGNTGNARTTPTHLHFGIYAWGAGAVNPYPFVVRPRAEPPPIEADSGRLGQLGRLTRSAELRPGPSEGADGDRQADVRLASGTPLRLRAAAGDRYGVLLADGRSGYLAATVVGTTSRPLERRSVKGGTVIRDAPSTEALVMDSLRGPERLDVLGRLEGFDLVRSSAGTTGWIER